MPHTPLSPIDIALLRVIASHQVRIAPASIFTMSSKASEAISVSDTDVEKSGAQAPALPVAGSNDGQASGGFEVKLEPADDPKCLSLWHKWLAVLVICTSTLCVTFDSSVVRSVSLSASAGIVLNSFVCRRHSRSRAWHAICAPRTR